MRKIITRVVKEGNFLNRKKISKIGVEGAPLHDMLVSQSDDKLACFHDDKYNKYYLYSLVDGSLIATSPHEIDCLSDNYFEMYDDDVTKLRICCVNYDTNTYEIVNENHQKNNYAYEKNMLAQYYAESKKVIITNMDNNEKYEFIFQDLPDLELKNIIIYYDIDIESKFMVTITFGSGIEYFNFFDINTKKFMFDKFLKGDVYNLREYKGELYIITHKNELLNQRGKILVEAGYDNVSFYDEVPYILLEKDEKYGLAHLENGEIIFETKYDEIIEEDEEFKVVSKVYTTYKKRTEEM